MDNELLDALRYSGIIFASLFFVAGALIAALVITHRAVLFMEKPGRFKFRCRTKQIKKDDKRDVVIAAAVAAYLKAEEENRR
ncbi:MAG: hypothetical protein WC455_01700 [Dehalococcoidia bacterium]